MGSLVITSIADPTGGLRSLAAASQCRGFDFILIGDENSPTRFDLDGCDYYGLDRQRALELEFAPLCPHNSYARKNIGYLIAMQRGAPVIIETDDDTIAYDAFWQARERSHQVKTVAASGWTNVYRYFSDVHVWPRGLPLEHAQAGVPPYDSLPLFDVACPIHQGLVDKNPDVNAGTSYAARASLSLRTEAEVRVCRRRSPSTAKHNLVSGSFSPHVPTGLLLIQAD